MAFGALLADAEDEVDGDRDVDEEDEDLADGGVAVDLVDFERDEGERDDRGEPLGPALLQPEADAFGEEERGVDEAGEAGCLELVGRDVGELADGAVDEAAVGVDAEPGDEGVERGFGVVVLEKPVALGCRRIMLLVAPDP